MSAVHRFGSFVLPCFLLAIAVAVPQIQFAHAEDASMLAKAKAAGADFAFEGADKRLRIQTVEVK